MKKAGIWVGISVLLVSGLLIGSFGCKAPAPEVTPEKPTPTPEEEEVFEWMVTILQPPGSAYYDAEVAWLKELENASGGRFKFDYHGAGEIMPSYETFDATSAGMVQFNITAGGYWTGKFLGAAWGTGSPPFTLTLKEYYAFMENYGVYDLLREAYADFDIYYVGNAYAGVSQLIGTKPIWKAADFRGQKIRTYGMVGDVLTEAGASPVALSIPECYEALERGTVDAVVCGNAYLQHDLGYHEVAKYLLYTPMCEFNTYDYHVNMDAWNSLPDDLQQLLHVSISRALVIHAEVLDYNMALAIQDMVHNWGVTVTALPDEEKEIMRGYSIVVMDRYSQKCPIYAEGAAKLKDYLSILGRLD